MPIPFMQSIDLNNQRILRLGSPSTGTDAVNKNYVDAAVQGLDWKESVRAATTGDIDLDAPGATIDGVTLSNGQRYLVKNQADATENGIYVFAGASATSTRAEDADTDDDINTGLATSVEAGTVNGGKTYLLFSDTSTGLGTADLNFTLMAGGPPPIDYAAGSGLTETGNNTFSVVAGTGILVGADVSVDPSYVVRKYAANVGDGSSTNVTITHGLGTRDVDVQVFTNSGAYDTVFCEVSRPGLNTVTLGFATAPAAAEFRAVVRG